MITLHPLQELTNRRRLNRPQARNFKAKPRKGRAGAKTRERDECCECARRSNAEGC